MVGDQGQGKNGLGYPPLAQGKAPFECKISQTFNLN